MESRKDEPCLWNANANGLNYTKKRQLLHPTEILRDALIITLVWRCSKRMQRKDSHILLAFGWIILISEALILASWILMQRARSDKPQREVTKKFRGEYNRFREDS